MDRTERFHIIDQMLSNSRSVRREQFLEALEISAATFKRDLEYLRDRLGAPIVWDRELRGYRYQEDADTAQTYPLPGLWFNTGEIQALLTMNAWLQNLQPGILSEHIKPLQARIRALLDRGDHSVEEITRRIRILTQPRKNLGNSYFQQISQALLNRRRLRIEHYNRASNSTTEREVSPQRLTFYRDNWYLDSWCHQRKAIRSFAVDALQRELEALCRAGFDVVFIMLEHGVLFQRLLNLALQLELEPRDRTIVDRVPGEADQVARLLEHGVVVVGMLLGLWLPRINWRRRRRYDRF